MSVTRFRTWLRIAHCYIPDVFTIPRAVSSAIYRFHDKLGSLGFRGFPQFESVALPVIKLVKLAGCLSLKRASRLFATQLVSR